ncbi:E3 ubiquitin-protein ligase HIP1 [Pyrus ussuriensis x Pyrus communis]|uniref:E3 ubiquitin-protein ligase HIP1 n=1 Tax=Pyrus ussuriensis x Pyrus communis TaxID=2448454 RepID=A0A5N5G608_9ROSA|nr:E3 ubiquitin-protein ligase HIP1 [Pyrus ussuriensis x Pyrus communis]
MKIARNASLRSFDKFTKAPRSHEPKRRQPKLLVRTSIKGDNKRSLPYAAVGHEQGGTHQGSGNGVAGSGAGLSGNERLPGSVLLARERLLERLRGMPPSENQRHRHVDDLSPLVRDWDAEILTSHPATAYSSTNLGSQIERLHLLQEANKKPPGLSQEVLDCLSTDIFSSAEVGVDGLVLKASGDCSICLESFTDGDKLICLPCEHRFHDACLSPWALIRGDCPYCRRIIVVDGQNAKRTT